MSTSLQPGVTLEQLAIYILYY